MVFHEHVRLRYIPIAGHALDRIEIPNALVVVRDGVWLDEPIDLYGAVCLVYAILDDTAPRFTVIGTLHSVVWDIYFYISAIWVRRGAVCDRSISYPCDTVTLGSHWYGSRDNR